MKLCSQAKWNNKRAIDDDGRETFDRINGSADVTRLSKAIEQSPDQVEHNRTNKKSSFILMLDFRNLRRVSKLT